MVAYLYAFRCGSHGSRDRDLGGEEKIVHLSGDPTDELQVLVENHCSWLNDRLIERAFLEYDECGTGALLTIDDLGDGDDLVATLTRLDAGAIADDRQLEIVW